MKAIMSVSVDTKILVEFQRRVPKNQRSERIEKFMKDFIDHNRYEFEKTQRELNDAEATVKFLKNQIKDMSKAQEQKTLFKERLENSPMLDNILLNIGYLGFEEWFRQSGEATCKRFQMSTDELRTFLLDKMKGE